MREVRPCCSSASWHCSSLHAVPSAFVFWMHASPLTVSPYVMLPSASRPESVSHSDAISFSETPIFCSTESESLNSAASPPPPTRPPGRAVALPVALRRYAYLFASLSSWQDAFSLDERPATIWRRRRAGRA